MINAFTITDSHGQQTSEKISSILANRWQIYHTKLLLHPDDVTNLVLTTVILHNMLRKSTESKNTYNPYMFVDEVCNDGSITEGEWRNKNHPKHSFFP